MGHIISTCKRGIQVSDEKKKTNIEEMTTLELRIVLNLCVPEELHKRRTDELRKCKILEDRIRNIDYIMSTFDEKKESQLQPEKANIQEASMVARRKKVYLEVLFETYLDIPQPCLMVLIDKEKWIFRFGRNGSCHVYSEGISREIGDPLEVLQAKFEGYDQVVIKRLQLEGCCCLISKHFSELFRNVKLTKVQVSMSCKPGECTPPFLGCLRGKHIPDLAVETDHRGFYDEFKTFEVDSLEFVVKTETGFPLHPELLTKLNNAEKWDIRDTYGKERNFSHMLVEAIKKMQREDSDVGCRYYACFEERIDREKLVEDLRTFFPEARTGEATSEIILVISEYDNKQIAVFESDWMDRTWCGVQMVMDVDIFEKNKDEGPYSWPEIEATDLHDGD